MRQTKQQILNGVEDIKQSKKVANNTYKIEFNDGTIAYRLHNTNVVTVKPNGDTVLNSGGWQTVTTKDRINQYCHSGIGISQVNGLWYVITPTGRYDFFDGITIGLDGKPKGKLKVRDEKKIMKLKKDINKYCNLITKDNLPVPNSGDCWYCMMHTNDGKSLGDSFDDNSHLLDHIKEGYIHGSILVNAMKERGYADRQIAFHYGLKNADTFKRAVRAYLQKRLIK